MAGDSEAQVTGVSCGAAAVGLRDRIDDELMADSAAGNREAFERLVARLLPRVTSYCAKLTRDAGAADDLAQDTLLALWNARASYRLFAAGGFELAVAGLTSGSLARRSPFIGAGLALGVAGALTLRHAGSDGLRDSLVFGIAAGRDPARVVAAIDRRLHAAADAAHTHRIRTRWAGAICVALATGAAIADRATDHRPTVAQRPVLRSADRQPVDGGLGQVSRQLPRLADRAHHAAVGSLARPRGRYPVRGGAGIRRRDARGWPLVLIARRPDHCLS